jgi:hypothetical protein
MFALPVVFAALSVFHLAAAMPAGLAVREDWKTERGWDGTSFTPAELDPRNAVKPTPGVSNLPEPAGLLV